MSRSNSAKALALERRLASLKRDILFVSQLQTQQLEGDERFRFQAKLANAKECWSEFKAIWDQRDELQPHLGDEQQFPTDEWLSTRDQLRDEIIEADSILLRIQKSTAMSHADSFNHSFDTTLGCTSKPSLPKIQIPTFSGDILQFSHFKDTFTSMVHSQPGLSGIEKFHYLLSSLKGEAAALIAGLPVEEQSYAQAWSKVTATYGNPRVLASLLINRIMDYDPGRCRSEQQRHDTYLSIVADSVESFNALKLQDPCGFVLASLALRALDPDTRREFELSLKSSKDLPKPSDVFSFVRQRNTALKMALDSNAPHRNVSKDVSSRRSPPRTKYPNRESRKYSTSVLHSTSNDGHGSTPKQDHKRHFKEESKKLVRQTGPPAKCPHCHDSHQLYGCASFQALTSQERGTLARSWKVCSNCLKPGHSVRECRSKYRCRFCKGSHHSLIHEGTKGDYGDNHGQNVAKTTNTFTGFGSAASDLTAPCQVLLGTALILIKGERGDFHSARAVLDSGSQHTFITHSLADRIGVCTAPFSGNIMGLGGSTFPSSRLKGIAACVLRAPQGIEEHKVMSVVVDHIASSLPSTTLPHSITNALLQHPLADCRFAESGPVDVLIGAEIWPQILTGTPRHSGVENLYLIPTAFGLVVSGGISRSSGTSEYSFFLESQEDVEVQLKRFWDIEEPIAADQGDPDEVWCEKHFSTTHHRNPDGRYVVRLPFKSEHSNLGVNRGAVSRRLQTLESKLKKDIVLSQQYSKFMGEYAELGHMTPAQTPTDYLIPHHGILQEGPKGVKLRVVFDASCPSTSGSLNDALHSGPKLQEDLCTILIRFRLYAVALCTDVVKMYRQILIDPVDRVYQHILWRQDPLSAVIEYELNTVTYGVKSSAFLALRVIKQLLVDEGESYPLAASRVANDMYVDDLVSGADSIEEATRLHQELCSLFEKGGFTLSKWASTIPDFNPSTNDKVDCVSISPKEDDYVKILGLIWRAPEDSLSYAVKQPPSHHVTKRAMLSAVAKIFDPLGLLAPVTLLAKSLIQEVWKAGLGWDDPLPTHVAQKWNKITQNWSHLSRVSIPRYATFRQATHLLIGYCDASSRGYAAALYLHATSPEGEIKVTLIKAKTKVAPLKYLSISRLELCGALVLSRLVSSIPTTLSHNVVCCTDSRVVLSWLHSPSHLLRTFEANRVAQIISILPARLWRHVKSEENPADLASRGCTPEKLLTDHMWWNGPALLTRPSAEWAPVASGIGPSLVMTSYGQPTPQRETTSCDWLSRFSSYICLVRNSARLLRFIGKKTNSTISSGPITADEFNQAEACVIRLVQRSQLPKELFQDHAILPKVYASLDPFRDEAGIIRVGGRLHNAPLTFSSRHPALLPAKSAIAKLIVAHIHTQHFHAGPTLTLSLLRSKFWVPGATKLIRSLISRCVSCRIRNAKPLNPMMGILPPERFEQFRAFSNTGVDYAGPLQIKESNLRKTAVRKGYLCLFVCMASKAVHLELVSSLSTPAFLAALERFIARRGVPNCIHSDHGTNFVGASRFLKDLHKFHQSIGDMVVENLASKGIKWKFIPPRAPHFGGIWEAGIKQVKRLLASSIGGHPQTYEELSTTLARVESLLNSRPLCSISEDVNNFQFLTPGHFLIGAPLNSLPEPFETNLSYRYRWCLVQNQISSIWNRWRKEYLHTLQQRSKWTRKIPNIQEGELVILMEKRSLVGQWPVARVLETLPGRDGTVRTVVVRTPAGNILTRPVSSLVPLFHPDDTRPSVGTEND